ncbi:MAG TPA: hypothetical protein VFI47_20155 [Acidimicrobiales bacterium]|nr:hypothetical protein [Acidimicrobiales bacterium]
MDGMSLLDVLRGVMLDPAEQAAYNADPGAYLERFGYDDVDPADLSEAFGLVADTLPPDQAQAAWEAAATPDDGSFGTVTADFDSPNGVSAGDDAAGTLDEGAAEPAADAGPEPVLSFGQGEAADGVVEDIDDIDDIDTLHAAGDDGGAGSPDDTGEAADAGDLAHGLGDTGPDLDDDGFDDGADDELDDGGADDGFDDGGPGDDGGFDGLDEAPPLGHESDLDGFDDLDQIDGFGALGDDAPDDTDIGSF